MKMMTTIETLRVALKIAELRQELISLESTLEQLQAEDMSCFNSEYKCIDYAKYVVVANSRKKTRNRIKKVEAQLSTLEIGYVDMNTADELRTILYRAIK